MKDLKNLKKQKEELKQLILNTRGSYNRLKLIKEYRKKSIRLINLEIEIFEYIATSKYL